MYEANCDWLKHWSIRDYSRLRDPLVEKGITSYANNHERMESYRCPLHRHSHFRKEKNFRSRTIVNLNKLEQTWTKFPIEFSSRKCHQEFVIFYPNKAMFWCGCVLKSQWFQKIFCSRYSKTQNSKFEIQNRFFRILRKMDFLDLVAEITTSAVEELCRLKPRMYFVGLYWPCQGKSVTLQE